MASTDIERGVWNVADKAGRQGPKCSESLDRPPFRRGGGRWAAQTPSTHRSGPCHIRRLTRRSGFPCLSDGAHDRQDIEQYINCVLAKLACNNARNSDQYRCLGYLLVQSCRPRGPAPAPTPDSPPPPACESGSTCSSKSTPAPPRTPPAPASTS